MSQSGENHIEWRAMPTTFRNNNLLNLSWVCTIERLCAVGEKHRTRVEHRKLVLLAKMFSTFMCISCLSVSLHLAVYEIGCVKESKTIFLSIQKLDLKMLRNRENIEMWTSDRQKNLWHKKLKEPLTNAKIWRANMWWSAEFRLSGVMCEEFRVHKKLVNCSIEVSLPDSIALVFTSQLNWNYF